MAEGFILKSGSSGDLDQISATSSDIRKGKVGVNGDGDAIAGTLETRSAINKSLNAGESISIPAGIYTDGKVTANSLTSQTSGTATAAYISSGKTAWVNGSKITGSLATQGGSTTTPGTSNKTIVTASKHVTGNIVVAGSSNLTASNIKKGVNIFGITGTFEGYVASTNDIFNKGSWGSGWSINNFVATQFTTGDVKEPWVISGNTIDAIGGSPKYLNKQINFASYNKINVEFYVNVTGESTISATPHGGMFIGCCPTINAKESSSHTGPSDLLAYTKSPNISDSNLHTAILDISKISSSVYIYLDPDVWRAKLYVTRIYLS